MDRNEKKHECRQWLIATRNKYDYAPRDWKHYLRGWINSAREDLHKQRASAVCFAQYEAACELLAEVLEVEIKEEKSGNTQ
jgi:hypothetical protein